MQEIWLIEEGEYSDRRILGYVNTEEDAKEFIRGLEAIDGSFYKERYNYYSVPGFTVEKRDYQIVAVIVGTFTFPHGWSLRFNGWADGVENCRTIRMRGTSPQVTITMPVDHEDVRLLERKAKDAAYQFRCMEWCFYHPEEAEEIVEKWREKHGRD